MAAISLAAAAFVYAAGVARVWRTAGVGRGISVGQLVWYAAGLLALAIALVSPLDHLSDESFAAHMLQHELLMVVAAPAFGYGAAHLAVIWILPSTWRRRAWRWVATPLASTGAACLAHAATLWFWHLPLFFDTALTHEALHVVQHVSFVATGAWFWASLAHGRYGRAGFGAAVVYLFATAVESGALGALLVFSPAVWYLIDAEALSTHGLTPLEDQQLAGLLMWVPASLIFAGAGLVFFAAWLREAGRRASIGTRRVLHTHLISSSHEATTATKT
jgi:putative membrane protein